MRNLTLDDLSLGLKDLTTTRKVDLEASGVGKLYAPQLLARLKQIEGLPEGTEGRANTGPLAAADARHDAFGNGIYWYTEAVLQAPDVSEAARNAAQRVREAFIPERSALGDSYAEEAAKAKKHRPRVKELEEDLKLLPVPDGKTLLDWVLGFLDAGDSLDKLLSERASAEATGGKLATELRVTTIGMLGRFRNALRDEMAWNNALVADHEKKVFAYLDELSARRKKKQKKDGPGEEGAGGGNGGTTPAEGAPQGT